MPTTQSPTAATAALILTGSRFSSPGLLKAASTTVATVDKNAAAYAAFKVDAAWKKKVATLVGTIQSATKNRDAAASDVVPTAAALVEAIVAGKKWRTDCMTHADNAFEAGPIHQKFHAASGKVGSSPARLAASLGKLAALAATYATALKAEGASPKFAAMGQTIAQQLSTSAKSHTAALNAMSPKVSALQASKGALYELLKRASRVARRQRLGTLNLASIAHVRTPSKDKKKTTPPAASPPATAAAATPPSTAKSGS